VGVLSEVSEVRVDVMLRATQARFKCGYERFFAYLHQTRNFWIIFFVRLEPNHVSLRVEQRETNRILLRCFRFVLMIYGPVNCRLVRSLVKIKCNAMSLKPQDVRLHSVETSKGEWGIYVQSVVETENKKNVFMTIILERNIDDEHIMSRKLVMSVSAPELAGPSGRNEILNLIRNWVDTTDGDGSIDGL